MYLYKYPFPYEHIGVLEQWEVMPAFTQIARNTKQSTGIVKDTQK